MKARKKGQCCHKEEIGNKTFFCVEPTGHQCAHFYFVTIEDLQFVLARAEKAEADSAALRKDAERYRWVRYWVEKSRGKDPYAHRFAVRVMFRTQPPSLNGYVLEAPLNEALDAAIDAAMLAGKEQSK